jgi:hypothetical protein
MISSYTTSFLLGTVSTRMQGESMKITFVERNKMDFLFFYKIDAILQVSCILHSNVPCDTILKASIFFNANNNPIWFDRIILVT